MTLKKLVLFIIIPVLLVSVLIYTFTKKETIKVKKVTSLTTDVVKTVSASGYIKSTVESQIAFPVAGKIINVNKKEGDFVKSGDLIAQVYSEDTYYEAESARKRKDSAQKTYDAYVTNYSDRTSRVGGSDVYAINVKKLKADLDYQDNLYKSSLGILKKTYLYAPFDGTITKLPYDQGEVVTTSNTVTLSDLGSLEFQADLDQEDYKFVKETQEAEITLDSYPDEVYKGKILTVPYYVDEDSSTKTFKLKISIQNKENKVVKGMTGDVNIIVAKNSNVKALPFDAVFTEEGTGKKFVWVVDNSNKISKKYVETGLEGDTLTEIKTDLPEFVLTPESNSKTIKEGTLASF